MQSLPRSPNTRLGFCRRSTLVLALAGFAGSCASGADGASFNEFNDDAESFDTIINRVYDPTIVNDIRLTYGTLPGTVDATINDRTNEAAASNYTKKTSWDETGRTSLMWMTPWSTLSEEGDFLLGFEFGTNHMVIKKSPNSPEIDVRSFQLTIHPCAGWLLDDGLHLEIGPMAGIGMGTVEYKTLNSISTYPYFELGARSGVYYTWRNGLQLGMQVYFYWSKFRGELGKRSDFDFETLGLGTGISLGYRL